MKKTVMIIEDQLSTRKLLEQFLSRNYSVSAKASAKEALQAIEDGEIPDAIVADILMPEMSGIEFLRKFQKHTEGKNLPVIMLSGVENSSEKMRCFQLGAKDYLVKPFNPEELKVRLSNLLNK